MTTSSRLFNALITALLALAVMAPLVHADEILTPKFTRPAYQVLRQNEDWSVLAGVDRAATGDWFDRIKYIPLSDDGDIWVGFGGSARMRLESWHAFAFSDANNDEFLLTRFSLHSDLHIGSNIRLFAEGKSALSTDRDLPGGKRTLDVDELDLQQLFVDVKLPLGDKTTLTVRPGRQMLLFGKQRLVSPLPWANTLRTWEGVSAILDTGHCRIHGFWTQFVPVNKYDFNHSDGQTDFWGVYATGTIPQCGTGVDLYFFGRNLSDSITFNGTTGPEDRYTIGGRLHGKIGKSGFDYDVEGAYQFGDIGAFDISAFMFAMETGYTFAEVFAKPRVWLGFDYASGDRSAGGDVQTFDALFPLGHAYYGFIDLVGRQNAVGLNAGASATPLPKLNVALSGHFFWLADDADALYNAGGALQRAAAPGVSRDIGAEIDLTLKYNYSRHISALLGYSHFFCGDYLNNTGRGDDVDFAYLEIEFRF